MKNIYDLVKNILETDSSSRNSDKRLVWSVCFRLGLTDSGTITYDNFMKAPTFESITRARRKVVELHPELAGDRDVEIARNRKQNTKGNFIFKNELQERQDISAPVDVMKRLSQNTDLMKKLGRK